jgi:hypothetical protein
VPCRIDSKVASRWSLRCTAAGGSLLAGTLSMQAGKPSGGRLARLTLPDGTALNGVDLTILGEATPSGATLLPQVGGLPARTAAGSAIGTIRIRRNAGAGGVGVDAADGEVTLEIRQDFSVVQQAIDRLAAGRDAANLFGPMPFPRERLFAALLRRAWHAGRASVLRGRRASATRTAGSGRRGAGSDAEQRRRSAAAQLSTLLRRLPPDRRDFSAEFSAG